MIVFSLRYNIGGWVLMLFGKYYVDFLIGKECGKGDWRLDEVLYREYGNSKWRSRLYLFVFWMKVNLWVRYIRLSCCLC